MCARSRIHTSNANKFVLNTNIIFWLYINDDGSTALDFQDVKYILSVYFLAPRSVIFVERIGRVYRTLFGFGAALSRQPLTTPHSFCSTARSTIGIFLGTVWFRQRCLRFKWQLCRRRVIKTKTASLTPFTPCL